MAVSLTVVKTPSATALTGRPATAIDLLALERLTRIDLRGLRQAASLGDAPRTFGGPHLVTALLTRLVGGRRVRCPARSTASAATLVPTPRRAAL